jgi:hypothetical protein
MASIPQQYREPMKTWTLANAHKATRVSEEYFTTDDIGEVSGPFTDTYIDLHELALRLGRKIWKAAPELRGTFNLQDLEELLDDKKVLILAAAGATHVGRSPLNYNDYKDENPDG